MFTEPRDDIERQVGALKLRIGVEDNRKSDGVRYSVEVGLDLRCHQRKVGFKNRKNTVGA